MERKRKSEEEKKASRNAANKRYYVPRQIAIKDMKVGGSDGLIPETNSAMTIKGLRVSCLTSKLTVNTILGKISMSS